MLPTTAILTLSGRTVTNQRVVVTQGSRVNIVCYGGRGSNPTWKKGAGSTATRLPTGVHQTKSSIVTILNIESLTPENMGIYACHIGSSTIETVAIGELTLSVIYLFNLMCIYAQMIHAHLPPWD